MNVALFVPCYVDQLYPSIAVAALELLEKLGCNVTVPPDQTCCGQPMANAGFEHTTTEISNLFVRNFSEAEYIVTPSGSCALHVREHLGTAGDVRTDRVRSRTFELCEFLTDVMHVKKLDASFPYRVGLHQSCHGLRGLRLASSSELQGGRYDKIRDVLGLVGGITLVDLDRTDECCGFGGLFAVSEPAISVAMGRDRLADHVAGRAEYITSADASCLMHMAGIASRDGLPVKTIHVAEILNGVAQ